MSAVFYECLDATVPSGGAQRIYRHVEILNKNGIEAYVLHHTPGFRLGWFESNAATCSWTPELRIKDEDVLVIPEGHIDVMKRTRDAPYRRVVIALNWAYIFIALPAGESWTDYNISHVIAGSEYESHVITETFGLKNTVIVSGIDSKKFVPCSPKKLQIAYTTRKSEPALRVILSMFRARYPEMQSIPFVPMEGINHSQVASHLNESAIFLAHSYPEGLSRKALEAMSSGCVVVGFAGGGSKEFMEHNENCFVAPDGDALAITKYLADAVSGIRSQSLTHIQAAARQTALRYSLAREESSVVRFWRSFLETK